MGAQWKAKHKELAANAKGRIFTKLTKECGEFWNRQVRKKCRCALPLSGVESKVKRSASANAKATLTIDKLIRRETEVKEDAINAVKTSGRGGLSRLAAPCLIHLRVAVSRGTGTNLRFSL